MKRISKISFEEREQISCNKPSIEDAEKGDIKVQYNLGLMYYQGQGVPKDYVKVYKWLNLAAVQDNKYAKDKNIITSKMSKAHIIEAKKLASEFVPKKDY
jgi:hypothetical protein